MKKIILSLFVLSVLFVGCSTPQPVNAPVNPKAKNYAQALESASKTCQVDADCTAVSKGCCQCQGKEVVNQEAALALRSFWNKECAKAICTLQMCYTDIETWCERGTCKSKPKVRANYAIK